MKAAPSRDIVEVTGGKAEDNAMMIFIVYAILMIIMMVL